MIGDIMKLNRHQLRTLISEMYSTGMPTGISGPDQPKLQISLAAWQKALELSGYTRGDLIDAKLMYHRNYDHGSGMYGALIPATSHYAWGDDPKTLGLAADIQRRMDDENSEKEDMKKYDRSSYQRSGENIDQLVHMIEMMQEAMNDGQISKEEFMKEVQRITYDLPRDTVAKIYKNLQ
tara:strand:- start:5613 stop:6149 length:537 start_codon:yes stop_codon:yes gene_type:complete